MKVTLTTSRASRRTFQRAGSVIELADDEAQRLIADGQAVPVREETVETTTRGPAPETARARGGPRRRRTTAARTLV